LDTRTAGVYYSPHLKDLLGYEDSEFADVLASFASSLHPDDYDKTTLAIRGHLKGLGPYDIEHRLRTKSGEYRWFRSRGEATRDANGWATRMAGSLSDVTAASRPRRPSSG